MRLDQRIVSDGLAPSRARAQALIATGAVRVDGRQAGKPAEKVSENAHVEVLEDPCPWVSRAGLKLLHALEAFALTPAGTALDIGASTGGFTEVLLAKGAEKVYAVDVGHGQLHPSLVGDPRVIALEGVNGRDITPDLIPPLDWITADVSFISLEKALPAALARARPGARLVALIKPQFEAGPGAVGKGGVLRDPVVHQAICDRVDAWLRAQRWQVTGLCPSPITGQNGNREFLITATAPGR